MQTDNVQLGIKLKTNLGSDAVQIRGNFTWGFKEKKEKADDEKSGK